MKKYSIVAVLLVLLIASFALPTFAEESCNTSLDYLALGHEQLENEDFGGAMHSANSPSRWSTSAGIALPHSGLLPRFLRRQG